MEPKDKKDHETPTVGLRLLFDTEYNEKTGLLEVFNLALYREIFQPVSKSEMKQEHKIWAQDVSNWPSGTLIHVVFQLQHNLNTCNFATAFSDRQQAELTFVEAEDRMWEGIRNRQLSCPGKAFSVVKVDKWHCDLLECVLTERGG